MGNTHKHPSRLGVRHMLPNNEEWLLIVRSGRAGFAIMAAAFAIDAVVS